MFLEILTRCYKRPKMLANQQASLARQTCDDWMQTLLIDDLGRGVEWSHENLAAYGPKLVGEYIWTLDDDDECIRETLVEELKEIAERSNPDLIIMRSDCGRRGILPPVELWKRTPVHARISGNSFVARREQWQAWAHVMKPGKYDSDFDMVSALFEHSEGTYLHNVIACRVQWIGLGRPEP